MLRVQKVISFNDSEDDSLDLSDESPYQKKDSDKIMDEIKGIEGNWSILQTSCDIIADYVP